MSIPGLYVYPQARTIPGEWLGKWRKRSENNQQLELEAAVTFVNTTIYFYFSGCQSWISEYNLVKQNNLYSFVYNMVQMCNLHSLSLLHSMLKYDSFQNHFLIVIHHRDMFCGSWMHSGQARSTEKDQQRTNGWITSSVWRWKSNAEVCIHFNYHSLEIT